MEDINKDIKILENLLEEGLEAMCYSETQAIDHLIKAYKELEEENMQLEAIKDEVIRRYNLESIPVSLVEEKIEELKNRIEKYREYAEQGIETDVEWVDNVADRETVKVLQELLEKRK